MNVLKSTNFSQTFVTAMGSPFSATIVNLVMEDFDTDVISKLDYTTYFYKMYVDDCFICNPKNKPLKNCNSNLRSNIKNQSTFLIYV